MDTVAAKAPREEVQQKLLELLAEQSRRVPVAVGALLVVVAVMAAQQLPPWVPGLWLFAALGVLMARRHYLARLPLQTQQPSAERLRVAVRLSAANGIAHGLMPTWNLKSRSSTACSVNERIFGTSSSFTRRRSSWIAP